MRGFIMIPILAFAFISGCENAATDPAATVEAKPAFAATRATTLSFRQVSVGANHTCGLTTDNRAYCWGWGGYGLLGDGSDAETARLRPVAVRGGLTFRQLSAGGLHTCGLTLDNRAYCWGYNVDGELGDGTTHHRTTPVPVAGSLRFVQIAAGGRHTCAVRKFFLFGVAFYRAYCWGDNFSGQLGNGTTTDRRTPGAVAGGLNFIQVSAGSDHTCALVAGTYKADCWGGDGGVVHRRLTPGAVAIAGAFTRISSGATTHGTCGLIKNRGYCWYFSLQPVAVASGLSLREIGMGSAHSCGVITVLNQAYCWGRNSSGGLGDGTTTDRLTPVAVVGDLHFTGLSVGPSNTCGVTTALKAYCWGANQNAQLGDGTTTNRLTPVAVAGP